jgi:hypothetical protein
VTRIYMHCGEPTSGLEPLTPCSLRVCGHALQQFAQDCENRINRRYIVPSLPGIAAYCVRVRVKLGSSDLRSPWRKSVDHPPPVLLL